MGKPYSAARRKAALEYLATHGGNYQETSRATGIGHKTLSRWVQEAGRAAALKRTRESWKRETQEEARARLEQLALENMLQEALRLSASLGEAIEDAPLGQRATALNQLLDKILKVLALAQGNVAAQEEVRVRVEFQDTDGSLHETPFWARANSEE